ncbi:phosphatase PAP2 family protein [Comamonas guangdongensis]|uniref:Phosphatase PAP2 family protein n=1 Tax=Comamonas guangdongensis TaxID=510515 RepID=A0ABV3ZUH2_9BURK
MLFFDPSFFHYLNASTHSPQWLVPMARFASNWLPVLSALPIAAGLLAMGKGWRRSLQLALLSMALAWVACRLIRWGFPMPRPAQLGMGQQWIQHGGSASFPSMHAAGAFALAQSVQLGVTRHRSWLPPLVWLLACAMALSRVVLGVHFPSDILAGAVVGCTSAVCAWHAGLWWARRRHGLRRAATPPAAPQASE